MRIGWKDSDEWREVMANVHVGVRLFKLVLVGTHVHHQMHSWLTMTIRQKNKTHEREKKYHNWYDNLW